MYCELQGGDYLLPELDLLLRSLDFSVDLVDLLPWLLPDDLRELEPLLTRLPSEDLLVSVFTVLLVLPEFEVVLPEVASVLLLREGELLTPDERVAGLFALVSVVLVVGLLTAVPEVPDVPSRLVDTFPPVVLVA